MSRLIHAIETFGDWSADFAEDFNDGIVEAVERVARVPGKLSGWSLDGLVRALFAVGRAVGGFLRVLMFYLPAGVLALTGHLSDRPSWITASALYALIVTVLGVAGHWRASRR